MIQTLGHKYKRATGWLGNKVKDVRIQGAKLINNPVVRIGTAAAGAIAGYKLLGDIAEDNRNYQSSINAAQTAFEAARR